ncbi:MAG: right-handed parallel beta-helix repeat-containing protein [Chitinophagales bacterium]
MIKRILTFFPFILFILNANTQEKLLVKGMKISKTTKIKTGTYKLDGVDSLNRPVILIEGNNIIVDFNGAILLGSNQMNSPDEFFGVAIIIRNSKNVVVKNLKARNYKVALLARNVDRLILDNCDLSYNYRKHLNSTQEKEDVSDWMSYHQNEKDEWLRYGAAIYLRNCNSAIVLNCKITGGQNALMMMECNDGKIYNNDFSFNSGIGIGMYRCNRNEVSYNKVDFNVRGYSHGVYNRGQDSAGILVYEQSNQNFFYKNSVTHGGDGFFLWAGQTTMDTGKGGCNENVLFGNDFSYAPTNGVEVTFSSNTIANNRIFECDHGIWGGYSYKSKITGNKFRDNRIAIAIEHGQHNEISFNIFSKDKEAIRLWARKEQPADWGYAKYRDTRSVDYTITGNSFNGSPTVINLSRTDSINIFENTYSGFLDQLKFDSTVTHIDSVEVPIADAVINFPKVKAPVDPFKAYAPLAGRNNILITEWGPYDFRYPIIWNTNPVDSSDTMTFNLIGPKGRWAIGGYKGIDNFSAIRGEFPASITAQKIKGERTDILIDLDYIGSAVTTPFGKSIPAGKWYPFSFRKFFQPIKWEVNWFRLDTTFFNPVKNGSLFPSNVRVRPVKSETVNKLDYAWWGGIKTDEGQITQFITTAEGRADLANGRYQLSVTWDDAVRVYVDEKLVIDEWTPSKYTFDESPNKKILVNLGGTHHFRIEHLELGGFATLAVKLTPVE